MNTEEIMTIEEIFNTYDEEIAREMASHRECEY